MCSKTVCIDIDGTLVHYDEWKGEQYFGSMIDGASSATRKLHEKGWYIIIFSTRSNKNYISKFLIENKVEFDSINENPNQPENAKGGKPIADVYVDDRALCFKGDWEQTVEDVLNFNSWEEMNKIDNDKKQHSKQLLINDFQQAFYMLRHYDEVNWNLTKFSFGQILVSLGACWTIFFEANKANASFILKSYYAIAIFILLLLSAAFTLISILGICKNRTYFVKVSRYINEHRRYAINYNEIDFNNISKMWSNPAYPQIIDWGSTQMMCLYLLCGCYLLEIVLAAFSFYSLEISCCRITSLIAFVIVALAICILSICKAFKK